MWPAEGWGAQKRVVDTPQCKPSMRCARAVGGLSERTCNPSSYSILRFTLLSRFPQYSTGLGSLAELMEIAAARRFPGGSAPRLGSADKVQQAHPCTDEST